MSENARVPRSGVETVRHHQRFLLRQMHFTQQFARMYRVRTEALRQRLVSGSISVHEKRGRKGRHLSGEISRVLGLVPGHEALVVGTLYKTLQGFTGFLAEYQKELVRIEAGDGSDAEADDALNPDEVVSSAATRCGSSDVVVLEDESGRVELIGVDTGALVTGMVVAVFGKLVEKGRFEVADLIFPTPPEAVHRLPSGGPPCYVALVSGLCIGTAGQVIASVQKLFAYLVGDTAVYEPAGGIPSPAQIAKVIIGGNIIDATDELRLKNKVKMDPSDHAKIADLTNTCTAAHAMQCADAFLAALADTVEVDVMPGERDPSNAYWPQQPLHPVMLPACSRRPSLRLVTNPYELSMRPVAAEGPGARIILSSGANIEDMLTQGSFRSRVDAMDAALRCGCLCPTAPNTLPCYPFQDEDPFLLPVIPHAVVTCNAPAFESELRGGVRFVAVPSLETTGQIVLMDINSANLDTILVSF